ncbi:MAG: CPBP family intramembrane glutamic endopeptidase [Coriobacteriia bacterium]|nr:CPBP family intramembrane glutamic endopeptidase [Coriobacteriia bacterium]
MLISLGAIDTSLSQDALVPLALPGVLMPSIAALILVARQPASGGARALLGRLLIWRVGWWWAFVVLLQPAVIGLTVLLVKALDWGEPVRMTYPTSFGALLTSVVFLLIAATGEEVGWRGYALPALQAKHTPLAASVILGLAAATWHLPYWVLQGIVETYGLGYFVLNYLFVVALTIQLTWIFNRTRSSILIAIAFHVVFNTLNIGLLPVTSSVPAFAVLTAVECGIALVMLGSLDGHRSGARPAPEQRIKLTRPG